MLLSRWNRVRKERNEMKRTVEVGGGALAKEVLMERETVETDGSKSERMGEKEVEEKEEEGKGDQGTGRRD